MKTLSTELTTARQSLDPLIAQTRQAIGSLAQQACEQLEPHIVDKVADPSPRPYAQRRYGEIRTVNAHVALPDVAGPVAGGITALGVYIAHTRSQHAVQRSPHRSTPQRHDRTLTLAAHHPDFQATTYSISSTGMAAIGRTGYTSPRYSGTDPDRLAREYRTPAHLRQEHAKAHMLSLMVGDLVSRSVNDLYGTDIDNAVLPDLFAQWGEQHPLTGMIEIGRLATRLFPGIQPATVE